MAAQLIIMSEIEEHPQHSQQHWNCSTTGEGEGGREGGRDGRVQTMEERGSIREVEAAKALQD